MRDAQSKHYHFAGDFQITQADLLDLSPSDAIELIGEGQSLPTQTRSFMLFYYDSNQLPEGSLMNYPNSFGLFAYVPTKAGRWQKKELLSGGRIQFLAAAPSPDKSKVFVILSHAFLIDLDDPPPENPNTPYVVEIILEDDGLKLVGTDYTFNQMFHNKVLDATSL